jgi:ribose transport system permease protein
MPDAGGEAATAGTVRAQDAGSTGRERMRALRLRFGRFVLTPQGFLFALILQLGIQTAAASEFFLTTDNLTNVSRQVAVLGILTSGTTILMLTGLLDLSIGAAAALTALLTVRMVMGLDLPVGLAAVVAVAAIVLLNVAMGFTIAKTKVPSFMLTLAVWTMLGGVNLLVQGDFPLPLPDEVDFRFLAQGEALPNVSWGVVLCVVLWFLVGAAMKWSPLVHQMRAVGSNEEAARLSGIPVDRVKTLAFAFNGIVVGLAGLLLLSRLSSASADAGLGLEIQTIAAVVIGGAALAGGRASILGSALGVILIGLISNSLNLQQVSGQWQSVLYGAIIAIAVVGRELHLGDAVRRHRRPTSKPRTKGGS